MRPLPIEIVHGQLHVPGSGLWFDSRRRSECSFVSHAHGDHIGRHNRVIATPATLALMEERLGPVKPRARSAKKVPPLAEPSTLPVEYRRPFGLGDLTVELFSAGHVLGSAQIRVSRNGASLGYTGDFCLEPTRTAEPAETMPCDVLVMESTFGLPRYRFPPKEEVLARLRRFVDDTLSEGRTPVLLAYALGKGQEVLRYLGEAGYRCRAHPAMHAINRVYERLGVALPNVRALGAEPPERGEVVVVPPHQSRCAAVRRIPRRRLAVLTGWAMDGGARFYRDAEVAFPLSDHADFPALVRYAKATGARKVLTLHGFAEQLADALRREGVSAEALRAQQQLELL
jgi:putative mRNA 3-end processing factor